MADLGFGIVGAGLGGRLAAAGIAATNGARLVALCRTDAAKAVATAAEFGVPCETDYDAFLRRADLDVVCVGTTNDQHARLALAAARAGKHVLVEKPVALTLEEADAVIEACRKQGVTLGVCFQRRTEPAYAVLHAAIVNGDLGKLVLGSTSVPYYRDDAYYKNSRGRGTWITDGGGALINQAIHLVDLLLWFMGDAAEVQASAATLRHAIEVEDSVTATLRFKSGAVGSIVATTAAHPGFAHRIEVYGSKGGAQIEAERVLRWDGAPLPAGIEIQGALPAAAGAGASPAGAGTAGHARLVGDFVQAIREKRAPLVSGEEGRRALAVVLAIYESARSGKPVRLG